MRMQVGPARREGSSRTIFHRPLIPGDMVSRASGTATLSINAEGIYADGSTYRYSIEFTLDELEALIARQADDRRSGST